MNKPDMTRTSCLQKCVVTQQTVTIPSLSFKHTHTHTHVLVSKHAYTVLHLVFCLTILHLMPHTLDTLATLGAVPQSFTRTWPTSRTIVQLRAQQTLSLLQLQDNVLNLRSSWRQSQSAESTDSHECLHLQALKRIYASCLMDWVGYCTSLKAISSCKKNM